MVTALRRNKWDIDKAIFYVFANKEKLVEEDHAREQNVAEVKVLRRLLYDLAKGPEPNPPIARGRLAPEPPVPGALERAKQEVRRLRETGRRLLWNQGLIDLLREEVAWDKAEDEETEEVGLVSVLSVVWVVFVYVFCVHFAHPLPPPHSA